MIDRGAQIRAVGAVFSLAELALAVVIGLAPALAEAGSPASGAPDQAIDQDAAAVPATNDIPISQILTRRGVHRYAVWVRVGERTVEALLDTGSTGLRVLPTVVPGDVQGKPTDVVFGRALHMGGVITRQDVEIGPLHGTVPVEVIQDIGCAETQPNCNANDLPSDTYLIGGDGIPSQGYSAILGIRFSEKARDLPNPLEALGATHWSITLPRPYAGEPGHLLIDPKGEAASGFTVLPHRKHGEFFGCLHGPGPSDVTCGSVLLDTGAGRIDAQTDGPGKAPVWKNGSAGSLHVKTASSLIAMDFTVGADDGPLAVLDAGDSKGFEPQINAGLFPFFQYSALYDATAGTIGLKRRTPDPPPGEASAPERKPERATSMR